MNKNVKEKVLKVVYFPLQLVLGIVYSPLLVLLFAYQRTCDQAFEDVWMTLDNPNVNPDGPTMRRKKEYCWIARFLGFDLIKDI